MDTQKTTEMRIAGFGGQGVILAGMILGRAVSIFENRHATLMQSFGPEARGGACSAQVVLADSRILYPYVKHSDLLVAMSQEALRLYLAELKPGCRLLYESDLVDVSAVPPEVPRFGVPATALAEQLRRKIVLNIVMVGFVAAVGGVVGHEAARQAVISSVPPGTESLNGRAFDSGYNYGIEHYGRA